MARYPQKTARPIAHFSRQDVIPRLRVPRTSTGFPSFPGNPDADSGPVFQPVSDGAAHTLWGIPDRKSLWGMVVSEALQPLRRHPSDGTGVWDTFRRGPRRDHVAENPYSLRLQDGARWQTALLAELRASFPVRAWCVAEGRAGSRSAGPPRPAPGRLASGSAPSPCRKYPTACGA